MADVYEKKKFCIVKRTGEILEGNLDKEELIDIFNVVSYMYELLGDNVKTIKLKNGEQVEIRKLDNEKLMITYV